MFVSFDVQLCIIVVVGDMGAELDKSAADVRPTEDRIVSLWKEISADKLSLIHI